MKNIAERLTKEVDMKFSEWSYTRPDYAETAKKVSACKDRMQRADSYQMFRDAWLDMKKEIEYLEYQEEIIYIRHLCGIDYSYSLEEVEIQSREEPPIYALRDACNMLAAVSPYRQKLEQEFGFCAYRSDQGHREPGQRKIAVGRIRIEAAIQKINGFGQPR